MSSEEIIDWMAYERSISKEFIKQQEEKAIVAKTKEQEAEAIKLFFSSMGV